MESEYAFREGLEDWIGIPATLYGGLLDDAEWVLTNWVWEVTPFRVGAVIVRSSPGYCESAVAYMYGVPPVWPYGRPVSPVLPWG